MKKHINSATEQYQDEYTDNLVLDDTPTKGSFNAVTSDGVAQALGEGGIQSDDIKSVVVVSEPPSNPDSETLYLIPEA